ncbi:MAG TPA: HAD-IA family hydrolase [Acidocella sp.]|jgi:phosphoglycolate phosphatase|nr:HAD-IA family hydrolase [Acidocella sp.]
MRAVVFDLDGTLIDAAPDITAVVNRVLAADGLPALAVAEVRGMIGDGAKSLLDRAFAARGATAEPRHLAAFVADYQADPVRETICYSGVEAALVTLQGQGRPLGVCTNKPIGPTRLILEKLGLTPFFASVIGGDSTPYRKPDPRHLAAVLAEMEVTEAIMVGDHHNDMLAAAGLGLEAIFCAWGYGEVKGAYTVNTTLELLDRIAEIG